MENRGKMRSGSFILTSGATMNDEQMRRTMDFIVEQQAQFSAHIQRHEENFRWLEEERIRDRPRMAELEKSFQQLVELARIYDIRVDEIESRGTAHEARTLTLEESFERLDQLMKKHEARLAKLERDNSH
jgi:DNA repair ATPase RecN